MTAPLLFPFVQGRTHHKSFLVRVLPFEKTQHLETPQGWSVHFPSTLAVFDFLILVQKLPPYQGYFPADVLRVEVLPRSGHQLIRDLPHGVVSSPLVPVKGVRGRVQARMALVEVDQNG